MRKYNLSTIEGKLWARTMVIGLLAIVIVSDIFVIIFRESLRSPSSIAYCLISLVVIEIVWAAWLSHKVSDYIRNRRYYKIRKND